MLGVATLGHAARDDNNKPRVDAFARGKSLLYAALSLVGAVWIWQYAALRAHWQARFTPAHLLNEVACHAERCWSALGRLLATLSSFILWLELNLVWRSLRALLEPLARLLVSGGYLLQGYLDATFTYAQPLLIPLGSALLVAALVLVAVRFERPRRALSRLYNL